MKGLYCFDDNGFCFVSSQGNLYSSDFDPDGVATDDGTDFCDFGVWNDSHIKESLSDNGVCIDLANDTATV